MFQNGSSCLLHIHSIYVKIIVQTLTSIVIRMYNVFFESITGKFVVVLYESIAI